MTLIDQSGFDVLSGAGVDRSNAASQQAPILYANTSDHPVIDETDTLTLRVDNNLVPSAQIQIDLYFALGV